ncbi:MAG: ABC transporter permease [Cyclobacteriaceae bacterium]
MIKRLADRLFRWFCHQDYYPDIRGDLDELYAENLERNSKVQAELTYLVDVIMLFRPSLFRQVNKNSILYTAMFENYFKTSFRNLMKHKAFSGINVVGLAIGLTAFLLITQYIDFERSYDRFFSQPDQLYRLTTDQVSDGVLGVRDAMSFAPSGKVLKEEVPEILDYTTTYKFDEVAFRMNNQLILEKNVIAADSNYFKLFDYQLLSGDPNTALNEPKSIVLTKTRAEALFGERNPIGETIELVGRYTGSYKITGVMQDVPDNTHYGFKVLISLKSIQERIDSDSWNGYNYYTYLKLDEQAPFGSVQAKMPELSRKYMGDDSNLEFNLQPVTDIHLYSDFTYEPEIHGSAKSVNFMFVISFFIIVIAWVNYVNLSTARAADRAKEVGLRKVIGAHKRQLFYQFLLESMIINFISALLAVGLTELMLPYFNQLIGKSTGVHIWENPMFLNRVLLLFLVGTVVSGFYPAVVLSEYKPLVVLRGKFRNSKKGVLLRKGLVVTQFAASIMLIASTFIVQMQVDYMLKKDLGIDINYVIGFNHRVDYDNENEGDKMRQFKSKLGEHSAILSAGMTSNLPGGGSSDINSMSGGIRLNGAAELVEGTFYLQINDEDFMPTVQQVLIAGRNFDHQLQSDTSALLVNEALLKALQVSDPESIVGQRIQFGRNPEAGRHLVVGVVKDFNRSSLKKGVEPTVYWHSETPGSTVVRLDPENFKEGLSHIETTWQRFFPDAPLDYVFLDDRFAQLYSEDQGFGKIFGTFSILAILVASLGLFGLSAFMAMQKTKEVGVRKVLGASTTSIISIFFADFLILVGISAVIGVPLVYWGMENWLMNYANRIDFPWISVLFAAVIVGLFALVTVGYQIYRVALLNPSKTLRYE